MAAIGTRFECTVVEGSSDNDGVVRGSRTVSTTGIVVRNVYGEDDLLRLANGREIINSLANPTYPLISATVQP